MRENTGHGKSWASQSEGVRRDLLQTCRLMTGIHSEKCIIRWFHGSVNITGCTYTNLDGIVYYTPRQCHIYSLLLCRGAKTNFPSTLLHPWLRYPYKKRQLAEKLKFNNMCISCIHGRDPEKWVTCQNGWSHHLQYYLQLKTKDVGGRGSQLWEVTRKSTENKDKCYDSEGWPGTVRENSYRWKFALQM